MLNIKFKNDLNRWKFVRENCGAKRRFKNKEKVRQFIRNHPELKYKEPGTVIVVQE